MPRRRPGSLVDLEVAILSAGVGSGEPFHGFAIAEAIGDGRRLTGHGTLYKALGRLATAGLLDAEWEDPDVAVAARRPRRRLYTVTGAGRQALAAELAARPAPAEAGSPSPAAGLA